MEPGGTGFEQRQGRVSVAATGVSGSGRVAATGTATVTDTVTATDPLLDQRVVCVKFCKKG